MKYFLTETINDFYFHGSDITLNSYFIVKLQNTQTNEYSYFTGTDISSGTTNYNLFKVYITTGATYNTLTASTINLTPGTYNYEILDAYSNDIQELTLLTGSTIEYGIINISDGEDNWANEFNVFLPFSGISIMVWD